MRVVPGESVTYRSGRRKILLSILVTGLLFGFPIGFAFKLFSPVGLRIFRVLAFFHPHPYPIWRSLVYGSDSESFYFPTQRYVGCLFRGLHFILEFNTFRRT